MGERFLDTLLLAQGQSTHRFTLFYGFDVPSPVGTARSLIAPPVHVPVKPAAKVSEIGWIVHVAPKDLLISSLKVDRRNDGKLAAIVRVIQTRSQSCKASIRFFRDVECALMLADGSDDPLNHPLPNQESATETAGASGHQRSASQLKSEGDLVSLSIPSHGVADLLVVFAEDAG